jgi:hypothetical protein
MWEEVFELHRAAEQGQPLELGWSRRGWRKRRKEEVMADRPSSEPVQLTKTTKVKDPDRGETIELAAGTVLSAATAEKLGVKSGAKG